MGRQLHLEPAGNGAGHRPRATAHGHRPPAGLSDRDQPPTRSSCFTQVQSFKGDQDLLVDKLIAASQRKEISMDQLQVRRRRLGRRPDRPPLTLAPPFSCPPH